MRGLQKEGTMDKRKIVILASVVVAVLLIAVVILVIFLNRNSKDVGGLYSSYRMEVQSGSSDETVFRMNFDKSAKTYEETLKVSDKAVTLSEGSYREKDGTIFLTSDEDSTADSGEQAFATEGKYLIATDFLYDGEIPDSDTFDVKCSYVNENNAEYSITFREDGTYTLNSNGDVSEGTYKRSGDLITRTDESSEGTIDYLIYKNQITNSYYIAE